MPSWGDPDVLICFDDASGYSDAGEAAAFAAVGDRLDGARILDVGVGTGRTTGIVSGRSAGYVGVDVTAEMIEIARQRFPGVDLRVADARDLTDVGSDGSFDVVLFSFNGIDAVDHGGRIAIVDEARRVLVPGGLFLFSSLNRAGVSFDERPWRQRQAFDWLRVGRHPVRHLRGLRSYLTMRDHFEDMPDWSTRLLRTHEFRFLVHFAPVAATVELVEKRGFRVTAAWTCDGVPVDLDHLDIDADYLQYVCEAV